MDDAVLGACYLSNLRDEFGEVDPRLFTVGQPYLGRSRRLQLSMATRGDLLDVNFSDFDLPVARQSTASVMAKLSPSDVELFPVHGLGEELSIINVTSRVPCFDYNRSVFTEWAASDGRSDKLGLPKMVISLSIDPLAAAGHHAFRVDEWAVALIVSEDVRLALGKNASGAAFLPVT